MNITEPVHLRIARSLIGTRETPGAGNSKTIMGWAAALTIKILGIVYNADSVPWCGLFVAHCLRAAGVDLAKMKVGVRAKAWATWGEPIAAEQLAPGAILVFDRPGGGHVCFYVGETGDDKTGHYYCLGGNQKDQVNMIWLEKARIVARRWPTGVPRIGKPVILAAAGEVSKNEA